MRTVIVGLLLFSLLLTAGYAATPQLARYFLIDWLERQGFNNVSLDIDHPSNQTLFIKTIQLSQQHAGTRIKLSASDIRVSYQAHQLLSQQRLQEILLPRIQLNIDVDSASSKVSPATDIALDQFLPADLIQRLPADRLLIGELDVRYQSSSLPTISSKASLDLTNNELISRLQLNYDGQSLGWTDLYFNAESGFQLSQKYAQQTLFSVKGEIHPQPQQLKINVEQQIDIAATLSWLALSIPSVSELPKLDGQVSGRGAWQLPLRINPNGLKQLNGQHKNQVQLNITSPQPNIQQLSLSSSVDVDVSQSVLTLILQSGTEFDLSSQAIGQLPASHLSAELTQPLHITSPLHAPWQTQSSLLTASLTAAPIRLANAQLTPGPLELELQPFNIQQPALAAELSAKQFQLKYDDYPAAQLSLKNQLKYDPKLPLQISTQLQLLDSPLSIDSQARVHLATKRATFSWQLNPLPLEGVETLLSKYLTSLPAELAFQSGQLQHQGQGSWSSQSLQLSAETSIDSLSASLDKLNAHQLHWHSHSQFDGHTLNNEGKVSILLINVGLPIEQLTTQYRLQATPEKAQWGLSTSPISASILGGKIRSTALKLKAGQPAYSATIYANAIELEKLLELEQQPGLTGSGQLDGELPLHWQDNTLTISGGSFANIPPGGIIRFQPEQGISSLTQANPHLKIALDALDNFHYHSLNVDVDYLADGTTYLATALKGNNPDWNNGHPVNLSLNLEENLIQLLRTLQFTDKLTKSIEKRYGNDK